MMVTTIFRKEKIMKLKEMYQAAAKKAMDENIKTASELIAWIQQNCNYDNDKEFFLVLGIGSELADLRAKKAGYKDQIEQVWKEKIAPNWTCDRFGKWTKKEI
jgi:hypothetical protein